jgi:hypothetical protein
MRKDISGSLYDNYTGVITLAPEVAQQRSSNECGMASQQAGVW